MNYIPVLSENLTTCSIGAETLRIKESIDYKGAAEEKTSIGRIEQFRQVDPESVWMLIADMGKENTTEWISVIVWHEQFCNNTPKLQDNASNEPATIEDLPF